MQIMNENGYIFLNMFFLIEVLKINNFVIWCSFETNFLWHIDTM